jgi:hypothetical protein
VLDMFDVLKKKLLLQDWLNNVEEPRKLRGSIEKIAKGDRISFKAVPQPELSNVECVVGEPVTYHFGSTQLTSFPLFTSEFTLICHMIVAKVKGASPYLALSKKVEERNYRHLCTEDDFQRLVDADYPPHLYVRKHGANMQDWMHFHYTCTIKNARGTKIISDNDVKNFAYTLFVAKDEHKALEIERYPSGHFTMYATIFLSLKHVQEIKHLRTMPLAPVFSQKLSKAESDIRNTTAQPKLHSDYELKPEPLEAQEAASLTPEDSNSAQIFALHSARNVKLKGALPTAVLLNNDVLTTAMQRATSHSATQEVVVKPQATPTEKTSLPCSLHMASKLIDEAIRNEMRVTDVIRKALGLETVIKDYIHFDMQLSDADYEVLAKRFDIAASNKEKIHQLIMEELGDFVGEPVDI